MSGRISSTVDRRQVLHGATALAVGGVAGLAGCTDGEEDGESNLTTEPNYKGWFDNVSNYARTKDRRNTDSTAVKVGVKANNGNLGFGPAAIAISAGTKVAWEWTGEGGAHNVVSQTEVVDSGEPVRNAGTRFEHTFDSPGIFKYVCEPHVTIGMKGAIFVALE